MAAVAAVVTAVAAAVAAAALAVAAAAAAVALEGACDALVLSYVSETAKAQADCAHLRARVLVHARQHRDEHECEKSSLLA